MGILSNGLLGPFKNKVGAVVGSTSRGQNIMKGLADVSSKPPTADQLEQQYRFSLLSRFFAGFPRLVDAGFKRKARKQSPLNVAFAHNYGQAFITHSEIEGVEVTRLEDKIELNCPALSYSVGPIYGPNCGTAVRNDNETCTFSWLSYPQSRDNLGTDRAGYLIWNASSGVAQYSFDVSDRSALGFTVPICSSFVGAELHFYMHFSNLESGVMGDSIYLGATL